MTTKPYLRQIHRSLFLLLLVLPAVPCAQVSAAVMNDYCIKPPFISEIITPNLLLMIDNSASMYDLAYADKGKKVCSNSATTVCSKDSDCSGGTCSVFKRQPFYCYDQTYRSDNTYIGYFDRVDSNNATVYYNYDFNAQQFVPLNSFTCTGNGTKYSINNELCVYISDTNTLSLFLASGNYLNWLTASKFDIEKQILTGGKFVNSQLIPESRGCVGQLFIKEPNTANFVNYDSPETNNPNTSLGITIAVRGPFDPYNPSAPSSGGQTWLEVYKGNYNQGDCQAAMDAITSGSNANIKQTVEACLAFSSSGTQSAVVKTKISYQQSMQACWQFRNGNDIALDDINTVKNQCTDIYPGYATCSNNPRLVCSADADCGAGNTCTYGPDAIVSGNPALLCGNEYEGQYYFYQAAGTSGTCSATGTACTSNAQCPATKKCKKSPYAICTSDAQCPARGDSCSTVSNTCNTTAVPAAFLLRPDATLDAMIETHRQFCRDINTPPVIDPTDAPSDSTRYDSVPPILSGTGVIAQLSMPVGTVKVAIQKTTAPTGLIQSFENRLRMGVMTFNNVGSASEAGVTVQAQKFCSATTDKVCTSAWDCPSGETCVSATATTNKDGAAVVAPIGKGTCSTTTATVCATNYHCPSGEYCVSAGVGDHTTGLVQTVDNIPARTWTPFSEAFYNAIGYFAQDPNTKTNSRTAMRINSGDFPNSLNPSELRCQGNNILLITDGMSTADRNNTVSQFAELYKTPYNTATSGDTGWGINCPSFGGSYNVDNLAWIAQKRNIASMNLTGSASDEPAKLNNNEKVTTWVVFNGTDNGQAGECNSVNLMKKTALNGGSPGAYIAEDPVAFQRAVIDAFDSISAGSASGTAASILSNSEGTSAVILQALFFPKKIFDNNTSVNWIGELHNLWYYLDPFISSSTIREDSDYADATGAADHILNLKSDKVASFFFDTNTNQTMVNLYLDTDGNGTGDTFSSKVTTDALKSIWKAGKLLWSRDISAGADPRTVYTQTDNTSLRSFSVAAKSDLMPYLDLATETAAENVISYVLGTDVNSSQRSRTVNIGGTQNVWRLGDIVSSTPRIQSTLPTNNYNLAPSSGYNDKSYDSFVNSTQYKNRGMAYVGANDGMLHAFNLGNLSVASVGFQKGTLSGSNLGREVWSFIPKNTLPYLKHLSDPNYGHLYFVDTTPTVADVSIGNVCNNANYWECTKSSSVVDANNSLDATKNPWRSVIIGGMGLGGASRSRTAAACTNCVRTPRSDPTDATKELGYSSYFALDITNPTSPSFMWEFTNPALGFATSGPAIIRVGDGNKNGRWFAVFASGPTGPIDTSKHQFMGKSDQTLKLFIVDLATGVLARTINTGITNAFAGSLQGAAVDTDRWNSSSTGFYQDDVLYLGYVQQNGASSSWNVGGVIRLVTKENTDPDQWAWSTVINGIGPVTVAISRLQDRKNKNLWLYWGTGRFFYKTDNTVNLDDCANDRAIYAVKEPCYASTNDISNTCTTSVSINTITDQTTSPNDYLDIGKTQGWRIILAPDSSDYCSERIITNPVATTTGVLFYTSFAPTADICSYGGNSYLWALKYDTGYQPSGASLFGKAIIQMSTGTFVEQSFGDPTISGSGGTSIFTANDNRRTGTPMIGKPPADPPMIINRGQNKPVKKILHLLEK